MKCAIREEYSNNLNFCDGDIYRHIRHYNLTGQLSKERRWLARLSESKRRRVEQLQKLAAAEGDPMRSFRDNLDRLVPFTGLWPALRLGTFHRLLTLRCPEELAHYVELILQSWNFILDHNGELIPLLDATTVRLLEGRCVRHSAEDHKHVEHNMSLLRLFPLIPCERERDAIMGRLRQVQRMIPSLHTFLEDTKYLEPCAQIMKALLPPKFKGSVRGAFEARHNGTTRVVEQEREYMESERVESSSTVAVWKSYRQLWLFTFRHFPEMIGQTPRKDAGKPKPARTAIAHGLWQRLASLASKCGYTNLENGSADPDEMTAREFLHHARPSHFYTVNGDHMDRSVRSISRILKEIKPLDFAYKPPTIASDRDGCGIDIAFRCGRPYELSLSNDRPFLFMVHIYQPTPDSGRRLTFLTTFAVKRDIFHAFFGSSLDNACDDGQTPHQDDSDPPSSPGDLPTSPRTESSSLSTPLRQSFPSRTPSPDGSGVSQSNDAGARVLEVISKTRPSAPETRLAIAEPGMNGKFAITYVDLCNGPAVCHALELGDDAFVYMLFDRCSLKFISGPGVTRDKASLGKVLYKIRKSELFEWKSRIQSRSDKFEDFFNNSLSQREADEILYISN